MVYIVEDDKDIREIVGLFLSSENIPTKTFENIQSLKDFRNDRRPDLYILDVNLPDGNGLDLARNLQKCEETRNIPILIMSAHHRMPIDEDLTMVRGFIEKPFDLDDFITKVIRLIS